MDGRRRLVGNYECVLFLLRLTEVVVLVDDDIIGIRFLGRFACVVAKHFATLTFTGVLVVTQAFFTFIIRVATPQHRFFLVTDLGRLGEQRSLVDLEWHEVLFVELSIVVVAELLAQQFEVRFADDEDTRNCRRVVLLLLAKPSHIHDVLLLVQFAGILQGFVVAQESADSHVSWSFCIDNLDIEVTHHVVGEVIACELE